MYPIASTIVYDKDMRFSAINGRDDRISIDVTPPAGQKGGGNTPIELLLHAVGSCSGMDVISFLHEGKESLDHFQIDVSGWRDESTVPALVKKVHMKYCVAGEIEPQKVIRAIQLSIDKYCTVAHMIMPQVEVTFEVHLNEQVIKDIHQAIEQ